MKELLLVMLAASAAARVIHMKVKGLEPAQAFLSADSFFFPYFTSEASLEEDAEDGCGRLTFDLLKAPPETDCLVNGRLRRRLISLMRVVAPKTFHPIWEKLTKQKLAFFEKKKEIDALMDGDFYKRLLQQLTKDEKDLYQPAMKDFQALLKKFMDADKDRKKADAKFQGSRPPTSYTFKDHLTELHSAAVTLDTQRRADFQISQLVPFLARAKKSIKTHNTVEGALKTKTKTNATEQKKLVQEYDKLFADERKQFKKSVTEIENVFKKTTDQVSLIFQIRQAYCIAITLAFETAEQRTPSVTAAPLYFAHSLRSLLQDHTASLRRATLDAELKDYVAQLDEKITQLDGILQLESEADENIANFVQEKIASKPPDVQIHVLFYLIRTRLFYNPKLVLLKILAELDKQAKLAEFVKEADVFFNGSFFPRLTAGGERLAQIRQLHAFIEAFVFAADFVGFLKKINYIGAITVPPKDGKPVVGDMISFKEADDLLEAINKLPAFKNVPPVYHQSENFFDQVYATDIQKNFARVAGYEGEPLVESAELIFDEPADAVLYADKRNLFYDALVVLQTFQHKPHFRPFAEKLRDAVGVLLAAGCDRQKDLKMYHLYLTDQLQVHAAKNFYMGRTGSVVFETLNPDFKDFEERFMTFGVDFETAVYRIRKLIKRYSKVEKSFVAFDSTYEQFFDDLEDGKVNERPVFFALEKIDSLRNIDKSGKLLLNI